MQIGILFKALPARRFHEQEKSLAFAGCSGRRKIRRAAHALDKTVTVHPAPGSPAHGCGLIKVGLWQPAAVDSAKYDIGQHLRQIGFDESVGVVEHIMKESVRPLMLQTAQPLPTPQQSRRSKSFRLSSQTAANIFLSACHKRRRMPSICLTASPGCPAWARNGGAINSESTHTWGLSDI
jgi:hypothetical protein